MDVSDCSMSPNDNMNLLSGETIITTIEGVPTVSTNSETAKVAYIIEEDPNFKVGSRFPDYQSFEEALKKYSLANNVVYTTVKSASIRRKNKILKGKQLRLCDPKLKVTWISLGCKHFGLKRSRGAGIRQKQRSYKTGCRSQLQVSLDSVKPALVITQFGTEHNHCISAGAADSYPERRRLSLQETLALQDRLRDPRLKAKDLQLLVRSTLNKSLSMKDIHNLRAKILRPQISPASEEETEPEQAMSPESHHHSSNSRGESSDGGDDAPLSSFFRSQTDAQEPIEEAHTSPEFQAGTIKQEAESDVEGDDYECVEYLQPTFMEDEPVLTETTRSVEKVNESWKCVYKLLEADNSALKRENARLRSQLSQLKQNLCKKCASRGGRRLNS